MHRFLCIILCCLVFLESAKLAEPLVKKSWQDYHHTPTNRYRALQHLIMPPSTSLTLAEKKSMLATCKKVHQRCLHSEECCSQQCVKRYKRCIHFWP